MRIALLAILCVAARLSFAGPTTRAGDPPDSGLVGKYGDLPLFTIAGCQQIPARTFDHGGGVA